MSTFSASLSQQLRHNPGRPLITFYDQGSGERVELSVTTYANWVAKAAGLLLDEVGLERGMTVRIELPTHWLSPVFLGAAWTVGLRVTEHASPDAVICGPQRLDHWATHVDTMQVLACSLLPMGVRFPDGVPVGVHDVGLEVWAQPDSFTAWDPPNGTDRATDDLTQQELMETAAAGSLLTDGGRLLSAANPASPPGMAAFTEPLARSGSLVLVANADCDRLNDLFTQERATARFACS